MDSQGSDSLTQTMLPAVTVLLHPDGRRLGERATLSEIQMGFPVAVARGYPAFASSSNVRGRALDDPHVSRTPLWIRREGAEVVFSAEHPGVRVTVEGQPLVDELRRPYRLLTECGVIITLGGYVVLWLHLAAGEPPPLEWQGLLGLSAGMLQLREHIARLARTHYPVLVRGESGAGKELVARAIHQASSRVSRPYLTLNMAAVPPSVAASELFGYERGAFTGAGQSRKGRLEQADGGTLFLDEIGETPPEVQSQLLRALDSGEIQPLGGHTRRVDVRVIAATDADLEARVAQRLFSQALFYRLQTSEIEVPALRNRQVDLPLLLHHFLREALRAQGSVARLEPPPPPARPWLGARLVETLLVCPFFGNVRELKNMAIEIALFSHDRATAELPPALLRRMSRVAAPGSPSVASVSTVSTRPSIAPPDKHEHSATSQRSLLERATEAQGRSREGLRGQARLTVSEVQEVLSRNDWKVVRAAGELGVARNTLVRFIEATPELSLPSTLPEDTIRTALIEHGGDVERAAEELKVSAHGLRLRLHAIGLRERPPSR